RPRDDFHLRTHPRAVRNRSHQGLRGDAHRRHSRQPVHRRRLHAPRFRLVGSRPQNQDAEHRLAEGIVELFKHGKVYDFMSVRVYWIGFSLLAVFLSFFSVLVFPTPTYGTDFKGGTEVEVAFNKSIEAGELRSAVQSIGFAAPDIVSVTDPVNRNRFLIRVQETSNLDEAKRAELRDALCFPVSGEPPADRCPPSLRPTEVKFS